MNKHAHVEIQELRSKLQQLKHINSLMKGWLPVIVTLATLIFVTLGIANYFSTSVSQYLPGWYLYAVLACNLLIALRVMLGGNIRLLLQFVALLAAHVAALHWAESYFTSEQLLNIGSALAGLLLPCAVGLVLYDLHLEYRNQYPEEKPLNADGPYCIWMSRESVSGTGKI